VLAVDVEERDTGGSAVRNSASFARISALELVLVATAMFLVLAATAAEGMGVVCVLSSSV